MRTITNLIQQGILEQQCKIEQVPVNLIDSRQEFASRVNLTVDSYKHNEDFMSLLENIRVNGQQEPIHLVDAGNGRYLCSAGYRRTLALQLLSSEEQVMNATAYVWAEGTDDRTLFQISTFTNAQRKNLSMVEKAQMLAGYKELYPDSTNAKINRDLSFGPNDSYVVSDFAEFWTKVQALLGNENNAHNNPEQWAVAQAVNEYINADALRQNMYMKLVLLNKKEQASVKQLGQDEFEVKLQLFKLLMDGNYTTLKKKGIKEAFIRNLKQVSDEDILNAPELNIDDSVDEAQRIEEELKLSEAKELISNEELQMLETSQVSEADIQTPEDIAVKALKMIYNGMHMIHTHDVKKSIINNINNLSFQRKESGDEDLWAYSGTTEFLTKLNDLFNKTLKVKASSETHYFNDLISQSKDWDKAVAKEAESAEKEAAQKKLELQKAKELLMETKKEAKACAKEAIKVGKANAKGVSKTAKNVSEKRQKAIDAGYEKASNILAKAGTKVHKALTNAGLSVEEATAMVEKAGLVKSEPAPVIQAATEVVTETVNTETGVIGANV